MDIREPEDRRPPSSSSSKASFTVILGFLIVGGWMFAGTMHYLKEGKSTDTEEVRIAEGSEVEEDVVYNSKKEIEEFIYSEIERRPEDGIHFKYSKEFSEENIQEIARNIDPFYGRTEQFIFSKSSTKYGDGPAVEADYYGVNIDFKISNEKYVYDSIVNSVPIPEDNTEAIELEAACKSFLNEYIKDGMSDYEKEIAIHDYIINNCQYNISDPEEKSMHSAYGVLIKHEAVCEGYARATALLLRLSGIDAKLVVGNAQRDDNRITEDDPNHMWVQAYIIGKWYNVDTTWDDPVGDEEIITHYYCNIPDDLLSRTHKWDKDKAEECSSMDMNYYKKTGTYFETQEEFQAYIDEQIDAGNEVIECVVDNPDLSEEAMSFIFEHEGVSSYALGYSETGVYSVVTVYVSTSE